MNTINPYLWVLHNATGLTVYKAVLIKPPTNIDILGDRTRQSNIDRKRKIEGKKWEQTDLSNEEGVAWKPARRKDRYGRQVKSRKKTNLK